MIIERNFTKEIKDLITQLKLDYDEADSEVFKHKYHYQRELLEDIILPMMGVVEFDMSELTSCIHKKDKLIEELNRKVYKFGESC